MEGNAVYTQHLFLLASKAGIYFHPSFFWLPQSIKEVPAKLSYNNKKM
jgi:hypothetical protein